MNRRGFLRSILGGVAVAAWRPDLLYGPERIVIAQAVPAALTVQSLLLDFLAHKYDVAVLKAQTMLSSSLWQPEVLRYG